MSEFSETPASVEALRRYFEAHEAAQQAISAAAFAACMAAANLAAQELRTLPRPSAKVYA